MNYHAFVGRLDRDCEVCHLADRAAVHSLHVIPVESRQVIDILDGLRFETIADYLYNRAKLPSQGRRELHLKFRDGWLQRVYDRQPLNVR